MSESKKTLQEKEGENILIWLAKQFLTGVFRIRAANVTDEMVGKGNKRVTFYIKEKNNDK
jgi:hypothetical protein